ncbi:TetR/AcrR family transcriptional regulator [Actinophytocola sp.]|uniref:TetR/AcrR family transcriptional regulator n=1 Tax=Actinophytocola sp. TaxID=1872138 RepID=UPI002D5EF1F1|nr:TetR/AcrR family transcriptional regulator [Actinophytocola sp.]HYQ69224.1 TetR/AcrR family transcriptional regulator [Actinophytocola sp.]
MTESSRQRRADARRNLESLLEAAKAVFATSGVDAPAKEITDRAGVGVGTLYRHFPQRSDLVLAVLEREIDACAEAGPALSATNPPAAALVKWIQRYTELVATKTGLASALQSGDAAHQALRTYVHQRMVPMLDTMIEAATAAGELRAGVGATDLLHAVALLCHPIPGERPDYGRHLVEIFVDGLRHRTG